MILRRFIFGFCASALLVGAVPSRAQATGPDLVQADVLVRSGQADAAWRLLEPHEMDAAGQEDFDYLLGIAALDSGRADRAIFILERVVGVNPNHAAARLDLARALFHLGDYDRARQELDATVRLDPPPAARATIDRYLVAIEERRAAGRARASAYIEIGLGTDSNVNAGVSGGNYYLPILNASLSSERRRVRYDLFAAGAEAALPVGEDVEIHAGFDLKRRHYAHLAVDSTRNADYYDTRNLDGRLGAQFKLDAANVLRFTAAHGRQTLDDAAGYRSTQSLMAEWRRGFDAATQGSFWLLDQRSRYGLIQSVSYRQYAGDQLLAGAGLVRGFGGANEIVAHVTAYGGAERATDRPAGNLDGDKRIGGLRIGGQFRLAADVVASAGFGATYNRYERVNALFLDRRRDFVWDASFGLQWKLARDWSLKPQYAYTRSDSNFGAYDYARNDFSLILRYDLR